MLSTTEIQLPTPNQIKTLTLTDLVIMNNLSVSLREQIKNILILIHLLLMIHLMKTMIMNTPLF